MENGKNAANNTGEIIIYQTPDKKVELDVKLGQNTVWLTQRQISDLFSTERSVIAKHLRNIFAGKELDHDSACAKIAHTARDGKVYQTEYYGLDAIISVGYRVNSKRFMTQSPVCGYPPKAGINALLRSEIIIFDKHEETPWFHLRNI